MAGVVRLSPEETRRIVEEYGITSAEIPSYGIHVADRGRTILIGVNDNTGEIVAWDASVYDSSGALIPPDATQLDLMWKAIKEGLSESWDWVKTGVIVIGAFLVWREIKK